MKNNNTGNEWFFIAENYLRNETKNFDIDVDVDEEIDTTEYVNACGGGEHYVIFKDSDSFEKNNTMFIKTYCFIDIKSPIQCGDSIAFELYFDND